MGLGLGSGYHAHPGEGRSRMSIVRVLPAPIERGFHVEPLAAAHFAGRGRWLEADRAPLRGDFVLVRLDAYVEGARAVTDWAKLTVCNSPLSWPTSFATGAPQSPPCRPAKISASAMRPFDWSWRGR